MKPTRNNEIDLLLRGLARRGGDNAVSPGHTTEDSPTHMDADELNSYAERALPAATLARYTLHLADCSRCRNIVSELARASGASGRDHLIEQATSSGFLQKLRAFLSPPVLHYALPALALFAVIAVSWVALREQRQSTFVARNESSAPAAVVNEGRQNEVAVKENNVPAATLNKRVSQPTGEAKADKQAKTEEEKAPSKAPTTADTLSDTSSKDTSKGYATGALVQRPLAAEPASPSPPKSVTTTTKAAGVDDARRKEEQAERDAAAREQEGERTRRPAENQAQVADSKARSVPPPSRNAQGLRIEARRSDVGAAKKADEKVKAADEAGEIRTVGGRRFRRQDNTWVDTAYSSSDATIIVARGSEQYRALVADEPGIRSIAEQLPGEVVLVWKGRAYRIR